jgi:hypothetical protein
LSLGPNSIASDKNSTPKNTTKHRTMKDLYAITFVYSI